MGFYQLQQYAKYLLRAKGKHGVHSPFVFDFVTNVLPHRARRSSQRIEALRQQLSRAQAIVEIEDFGAGYAGASKPIIQKTMQQVVRSSARGSKEGALLTRICERYAPQQVLELGTNLGFSTLYLRDGLTSDAQLITLEGAKELSKLAASNLKEFGFEAQQIVAEFSAGLNAEIPWEAFHPGLVLLDGNHRKQPTLDYFEFLLPRVASGAILILDDIYWSPEMQSAWASIIAHERVTVSIDLFALGICFLDRPQAKEHFTLRFRAW